MDLLKQILGAYKELESPQSFWYWSALAAISAIVKDNLYLDRGGAFKTYPNIYVMLYADSGLRKGPPVSLAKRLVKSVNNTKIISGRSSIQGILKELGTAESKPGGKIQFKSTAFICASEFTSSLVTDPSAMTILTDLYDRSYNEGDYKSLLKMETFQLKDPTLTILVGTNEAHFEDFVGSKDVHGGFMGRMFVIAESKYNTLNPLIRPLEIKPDEESWTSYLKEIGHLQGPFKPFHDTKAGNRFEEWYLDFYKTIEHQKVKDPTGTMQRVGDSVIKVAMLISLSKSLDLEIQLDDIDEAIEKCEGLVGNIRKTTMGKRGKSSMADQKLMIINELLTRDNHAISREVLSRKYWMHFNATELDEMIRSFEMAGLVVQEAIGSQIIYRMPEEQVLELEKHFKGKN